MTAQGFSHSEFLVVGVIVFAIGVGLFALARSRRGRSPRRPADAVEPAGEAAAPDATPSLGAAEPNRDAEPPARWPLLIDPDAGTLDADERSSVLTGLGIVGDRWCIGVLAEAFEQERDAVRLAAIDAIGRCDDERVAPMLALAYGSPVVEERYAAIDAASRRGDVPLLERGLRDADAGVALAAAYGLQRAGRTDLVAAGLAMRSAGDAVEIRRVLAVLG